MPAKPPVLGLGGAPPRVEFGRKSDLVSSFSLQVRVLLEAKSTPAQAANWMTHCFVISGKKQTFAGRPDVRRLLP